MKNKRLSILLLPLFFSISSCSSEGNPTPVSIDQAIKNALYETIKDEYKAQVTYERIMVDFGLNTKPFVNIKKAEIKHAEAIESLLTSYQLAVPENDFKIEDMENYVSISAACSAGVIAEIANIELYDEYLALDLPEDIRRVFISNRAASEDSHLPAFQNCK